MEGDLVIPRRGDLVEVAIPRLARVKPQFLPCRRSQVHLTSAAVNGLPSCQLTLCRSLKVSSLPSSLQLQLSARSGTIVSCVFFSLCWSNSTRLLNSGISTVT